MSRGPCDARTPKAGWPQGGIGRRGGEAPRRDEPAAAFRTAEILEVFFGERRTESWEDIGR